MHNSCSNSKYQFRRSDQSANSNANSVTEKREWHAIVREKLSSSFRVTGARSTRKNPKRFDKLKFIGSHARRRNAHSILAYHDRNFANFNPAIKTISQLLRASRIEKFPHFPVVPDQYACSSLIVAEVQSIKTVGTLCERLYFMDIFFSRETLNFLYL